ncbi:MAG: transcriptional repressor [Chloroflexi bacterium]|nr:transcriptional repressor [Chloroflexota bacterium]
MQHRSETVEAIRATGHRVTIQRVAVLDAIREMEGHVAVDKVAARVRAKHPQMDLATVYRIAGLLSRLHLLNEVSIGGVSHYEYALPGQRHGHMVCEHCGATIHAMTTPLDELREALLRDTGFELHLEHLTMSGLCLECRQDEGHSHSGHTHAQAQHHEHPAASGRSDAAQSARTGNRGRGEQR